MNSDEMEKIMHSEAMERLGRGWDYQMVGWWWFS